MNETDIKPPGALDPPSSPPRRRRSALDRPAARVAAFGVFLLAASALGWFHRDDIFRPAAAPLAGDPTAACIAERGAVIDAMAADGTIDAARAQQFKASAEALCRARTSAN